MECGKSERAAHMSPSSMSASPTEEAQSSSHTHTHFTVFPPKWVIVQQFLLFAFCGCVPVALGVLVQFLHLQPGPHLLPILHCHVLHAVTLEHEQPRNCRPSWCLTAATDSQSHSNFSSKYFQPYWVMSGYVMFSGSLIPHV